MLDNGSAPTAYWQAPLWVWVAGGLWLVLALVAALALDSAVGRSYLERTLRTSHYTQVYRFVALRLNDWVWGRVGKFRTLPDGTETPLNETPPSGPCSVRR